ncbi:MAG: peptidylprolyl isomerase [Clostridiales bacterium]|nr:peptidylprolyl isomerase [Clostridiales bacterium]
MLLALVSVAVLILVIAAAFIIRGAMAPKYELADENHPVATLTMENGKKIVIELYPEMAPNTVANFVELASSKFYDGLTFHRVIKGFMIQGGDPEGTGRGGPGYAIKGEFSQNGFEGNTLSHTLGTVSMARQSLPLDSAGSQFFIVTNETEQTAPTYLDGAYAAFGKVVYGMDTAMEISRTATDSSDRPKTAQVIKSIRVDTKGVEYKAEKIEK